MSFIRTPLVDAQITGADLVARMIARDLPRRLHGAQDESMRESINVVKTALQTDAQRSRFTGEFADSIQTRIEGIPAAQRFIGRIGPTKETAAYTEYGRGTGKFPPVESIRQWASQKLGDESLAFVVAKAIAAKGTLKGKRKGYPRGWAHLRYTAKRRQFKVRQIWRLNIKRAVRLAGGR